MKLNLAESTQLAKSIIAHHYKGVDVAVCPSFPYLQAVSKMLDHTEVMLGAQDMFWEESGAYTGEVSPTQLKDFECAYVLVGHSERRAQQKETDEMINKKVKEVLAHDMIPVLCVGESEAQRREGNFEQLVIKQIDDGLAGIRLTEQQQIVIAYEPVWAIGTGSVPTTEDISHMQQVMRHSLLDQFSNREADEQIRIIYGGSVDSKNAASIAAIKGIAGVLPGGASLKPQEFDAIIKAFTS